MTIYEEVIDNLKYAISGSCTEPTVEFADEIELAIETLEKQIPKKPKGIIRWAKDDFANGKCSICARFVTSVMCYCDGCGNKLDWSEEK